MELSYFKTPLVSESNKSTVGLRSFTVDKITHTETTLGTVYSDPVLKSQNREN